jgi:hypothetical protein
MIFDQLRRLAVRHALQELEDGDSEQQHRLDGSPAIFCTVTFFELRSAVRQDWPNLFGEELVAVIFGKQSSGNCRQTAKERALGIEVGQTHSLCRLS